MNELNKISIEEVFYLRWLGFYEIMKEEKFRFLGKFLGVYEVDMMGFWFVV